METDVKRARPRAEGKKWRLRCTINGRKVDVRVHPHQRLLDVLREELFLTGAKEGCGKGECGACTIFFNGHPADACLMLAIQAEGAELVTIEGLATDKGLDTVQEMFIREGGVQCGFCIPGMIMAARALIDENPNPTLDDVKYGLGGNLCRCTGYSKIFNAVLHAARLEYQQVEEATA
ncbi:MAG: (2Fe-2S)-binding protein [Armatimonadetes bacterium]|nr:(2Fe-2S)-binding protein [Armatimonadota bacterium]